jgi:hypothetical protein
MKLVSGAARLHQGAQGSGPALARQRLPAHRQHHRRL